jgi:glycosyltransferase 2 family protein
VIAIAKWIWIACVIVSACIVVSRTWDDISGTLTGSSPWLILVGALLTVLAKLFLAENARLAAGKNDLVIGYGVAARLYNLSQLGKYLPGSVWQFVGRAAAYRHMGAGFGQIRDSLLVESLWVVAGAAIVGIALTGPAVYQIMLESLAPAILRWLVGGFAVLVLGGIALVIWRRDLLARYFSIAMPPPRAIAVQGAIWLLLGIAFWALARACGIGVSPMLAIGLFSLAYAIGFLVPFAPAGLGVRDAILTVGLLPFALAGEALAVTVLARLVYLAVDLFMVAIQEIMILTPLGRRSIGTASAEIHQERQRDQ